MNAANVLIGTGILWGLNGLCVIPLANYWLTRKLAEPVYAALRGPELTESEQASLRTLATKYYILADVLVLGAGGLVAGLMGYWFIGVSFRAKGWPGMLTFIAACLLGAGLRS